MEPFLCNYNPLLGIISSLTDRPDVQQIFTQHLPFQLIGILLVMLTLAGLYIICLLLGALLRKILPSPPAPAPSPSPNPIAASASAPPGIPAPDSDGADPRVTAAIAAAVAAILDHPHRVLAIESTAPPPNQTSAWAIEGRFKHLSSHNLR